jgi:hypothetical protein
MNTNAHFFIISRSLLLRMRNESDKSCGENQNAHFLLNDFLSKNPTVYDITCNNFVQPDRPQMTIMRMCIACWIPKTTNTH